MRTEKEIKDYAQEIIKQTQKERKMEHWYLVSEGKQILSTLMWVLEDFSLCDINRL